ncbi:MAG: DUF3592 domain-containing protein [Clostridiales bacterium]|jgi:hypothetical protein|nr:DUF3592 domain-containing protein [Clostridiales bacterium]
MPISGELARVILLLFSVGFIIYGLRKVIRLAWMSLRCRASADAVIAEVRKRGAWQEMASSDRNYNHGGVQNQYKHVYRFDYAYQFEDGSLTRDGVLRAGDISPHLGIGDICPVRYNPLKDSLSFLLTEERKRCLKGEAVRYVLMGMAVIIFVRIFF